MLSLTRRNRKGRGEICMNVSATSTARPVSARSSVGAFARRYDQTVIKAARQVPALAPYDFAMVKGGLLIVNPNDVIVAEVIRRPAKCETPTPARLPAAAHARLRPSVERGPERSPAGSADLTGTSNSTPRPISSSGGLRGPLFLSARRWRRLRGGGDTSHRARALCELCSRLRAARCGAASRTRQSTEFSPWDRRSRQARCCVNA